MKGAVIAVQVSCRVLVVAYDTSFSPPGRIAWVGEDASGGSAPLYFDDLSVVAKTGIMLYKNGPTNHYKIDFSDADRDKLRRIFAILEDYLMHNNTSIAPDSFKMEWRFKEKEEI